MRFQFGLRNALWMTAWLSLFAGSCVVLGSIDNYTRKWPDVVFVTLLVVLWLVVISTPVIAVCTLFGRTRTGVIAGLAISALYVDICLIASWILV
jgi:hypothetical protein